MTIESPRVARTDPRVAPQQRVVGITQMTATRASLQPAPRSGPADTGLPPPYTGIYTCTACLEFEEFSTAVVHNVCPDFALLFHVVLYIR